MDTNESLSISFIFYFFSTQKKKDYEIEMNRYLLVSILLWRQTIGSVHFLFGLHFKHVVCESQSISEEEQQRILSEQKMGSFKKGGSSPASKKKSSKAKVSSPVSHLLGNLKD